MPGWSQLGGRTVMINSVAGYRLNDPDMAIAGIFVAEVAKVPSKMWVFVHAEAGTSPAYTVRIESVAAGLPNGVYDANATVNFTATAAGWKSATFAVAPASLVKGTTYAMVVLPSGTPDASNYIDVRYSNTATSGMSSNRKQLQKDALGAWEAASNASGPPYIVIEFSDGSTTWVFDAEHSMVSALTNPGAISTTNQVGVRFVAPVTGTLEYARVALRASSPAVDITAVLRKVGGSSDMATQTVEYESVAANNIMTDIVFPSPSPAVVAGNAYVLYFRVASGTAWQMMVSSMGASCPPLPAHMREMTYVAGNAEPPATADAQYLPIAQLYFASPATDLSGGLQS